MEPLNLMVSLSHNAADRREQKTDPITTESDVRVERTSTQRRRRSARRWVRFGWRGVTRVATR
ncbi:hypothetical protein E0H75_19110 [Kribbella capetownensis]|uniref:Uncharacterized protein n=1 Tax=Kribbella capetownensis TaxID=1572659 RepID=A0A4V2M7R2_9ACTN|nr:hypothetical protein [Kribbella capetownensis]TCC48692.1 hypothetical protein E0H75_19110 [Kribbella capetownensis]